MDWPFPSLHTPVALTVHGHVACAGLHWPLAASCIRGKWASAWGLRAFNLLHFAVQQKAIVCSDPATEMSLPSSPSTCTLFNLATLLVLHPDSFQPKS